MKTPENTEEESNDPKPADEGDTQMDHSSHYMYSCIRTITKN
jgi:hypothetical protein